VLLVTVGYVVDVALPGLLVWLCRTLDCCYVCWRLLLPVTLLYVCYIWFGCCCGCLRCYGLRYVVTLCWLRYVTLPLVVICGCVTPGDVTRLVTLVCCYTQLLLRLHVLGCYGFLNPVVAVVVVVVGWRVGV